MNRSRVALASLLVLGLVIGTRPSFATVGGPEIAEILGWDPIRHEVFFQLHDLGDADSGPSIGFFALDGPRSGVATYPKWSTGDCEDDSTCAERLAHLRRRLRPLKEVIAPSIPYLSPPADREILSTEGQGFIRYVVHLAGLRYVWQGRAEVVTYGDSVVRVVRVHSIPGRGELVLTLSFVGMPMEGGYEVQVPVLLTGEKASLPRVTWRSRE
jgi:hypothetical protein